MKELYYKFVSHKWYTRLAGAGLVILAWILAFALHIIKEGQVNWLVLLLFSLLFCGGMLMIFIASGLEVSGGFGNFRIEKKGAPLSRKLNTLNILVRRGREGKVIPWKIFFSCSKYPRGIPHKLENNGQYYYVQILDVAKRKMVEMNLPDTIYLDPRKYVIPLTMPANAEYWKPVITTWEKVKIFAIVGILGIEWLVYLTTIA